MGFSCGIVGLPNVGKSTLFNALTSAAQAEAANYPFCTIEPNVGRVGVPDPRLDALAALAGSKEILPTHLEFVDIAGLVRGASKGEGLGNQFLAHIREVDAIVQVLRCFEDGNITHVENRVDPIDDADIILSELMIADMESLEKQKDKLVKKARGQDKEAVELLAVVEKLLTTLNEGNPAHTCDLSKDEQKTATILNLLTIKPMMIVCNVEEDAAGEGNALSAKVQAWATDQGMPSVVISAKIEEEIAQLSTNEEKTEFLETLGLEQTGLARIIQAGYTLLDLMTFFTVGPKEARAWTITSHTTAPQSAGRIHTDFEKGFIRAETIAYDDYIHFKGEQGAKEAGKMRLEGKEYIAKDGDIFHFRFNV